MTEKTHRKEEIIIEGVEIVLGKNLIITKEIIPKIGEIGEKINVSQVKSSLIIRKNLHKRRKETIKVNGTLRKSSFLVKESVN